MPTYIIEVPLSGRLEQREDGTWVSYNSEFGFINYGATQEEAVKETQAALTLVTDALQARGGIDAVRRWLAAAGVTYLVEAADNVHVQRYQVLERRELSAV